MSDLQEPPAGAISQTVAEAPQVTPQAPEPHESSEISNGLIKQHDQARETLAGIESQLITELRKITKRELQAVDKLTGILPIVSESPENSSTTLVRKAGTLIGVDGKVLKVSLLERRAPGGQYSESADLLFQDPAAPEERVVDVRPYYNGVTLFSTRNGSLDEIEYRGERMDEVEVGIAPFPHIRRLNLPAGMRGTRDLLEAANEGLDFILSPDTTLKPVETPAANSSQPASTTPTA
ncbi:MAG TPA: hypothetical protein VMR77_01685 [Patescibacteria group bacterium]|nr:hypothetical protein [Patescibacteria group bacterium]